VVVAVAVMIPLMVLGFQSWRMGLRWQDMLGWGFRRVTTPVTGLEHYPSSELPKGEKISFLVPQPIGEGFQQPPMISHVLAIDLDRDSLLDVLVCDCTNRWVSWIRQDPRGQFTEYPLCTEVGAPAHVDAVDMNGDGHLDLLVADLGMLFPNNDPIGSVVILENDGRQRFRKHIVLKNVPRVADVRAGDLTGDELPDLSVAHFGYDDGETRWLENLGNWQFRSHVLQSLSGPIHAPIADMDGDGQADIVVLVSQEWEEIYVYQNRGNGQFRTVRVWGSENEDFGSSGIFLADLNSDGLLDILYTNGDAFDYLPPRPRPWHGLQWLENRGGLEFVFHRLADFPGAVNVRPDDIDRDGDLDLYVASAYNMWEDPGAQSLIWLENDGQMRFRPRDLANRPTHIQGLDLGDFDGDGDLDLVTGGLHTYGPFDRMERVVLWHNRWGQETP